MLLTYTSIYYGKKYKKINLIFSKSDSASQNFFLVYLSLLKYKKI